MTDFAKSLEDSVDKDETARKRSAILQNFQGNPKATLEDLFNVCENSKLGAVMKTISLEEIWSVAPQLAVTTTTTTTTEVEVEVDDELAAAPRKKRGKKAAKKKATKKASKSPKKAPAAKKKASKKASKSTKKAPAAKKKATKKKTNGVVKKKAAASAAGGRKARQDYDQLGKEVVAYMTKQGALSTGELQKKFGISGSQARKVCDLLVGQKVAKRLGKGGRGVKYDLR